MIIDLLKNKHKPKMIGFMRNGKKPIQMVKLLAKTSKYNGIDLVYFNASNVDIEKRVISGKVLIENKWVDKEVPIPPFIDVSPYCFKHKEVINFLKENSRLSNTKLGSKTYVYNKISEDGVFSNLIIPTDNFSNFDNLHDFLVKHRQIIIKPQHGLRGNNIYMLSVDGNKYTLSYQQQEEQLSLNEIKKFVEGKFNNKSFVLQKYIQSKTKSNEPFDCRIRLEKNGHGKWVVPIYLIRIGTNQKVVSNVAQGGSVTTLKPFLEANFSENAEEIETSIRNIAKNLPYRVEKIFNKNINSLGIDIGIDRNSNELFLFEIETGPGFEFALGEIALVKSEYYKYILNQL